MKHLLLLFYLLLWGIPFFLFFVFCFSFLLKGGFNDVQSMFYLLL